MINWFMPWEPSILVPIVLFGSAAIYTRGCRRVPSLLIHRAGFWSGLFLFYLASFTQFDYYAEHVFFMHRLQHAILHHIAPFLIALSRPGPAFMAGTPLRIHQPVARFLRGPVMRGVIDFLNQPVVATSLFIGLTGLWLIPRVHFVAMLDWRYYRLMNWAMALNGLMFWNLVLNNIALRPAFLTPATRIIMMLSAMPPQILLGALIFLAPNELYSVYSICGRALPGINPMVDQQIGGFLIWGPTAMMSVPGIIIVAKREWMGRQLAF